jgi:L-lactate dehydrogenase complex protein LldG
MSSRDLILSKIQQSQPSLTELPELDGLRTVFENPIEKFKETLDFIGGRVVEVSSYADIEAYIKQHYKAEERVVSNITELANVAQTTQWQDQSPHQLADVELGIVKTHFGVAENAAVWITEDLINQRVLPFICQNLAVVVSDIVPTMHHAYERIGTEDYAYGSFVAGPSKTADIEQSLVLGAHGARTMLVFLMK